eukprot:Gregarina_sp_Poly_1__4804@NODE_255_length_10547_cov_146_368416_g222_i0_p11_GENE_NODE_255_length_10547_cov_146_368416_g222_i0NODE_255_length_10547_cov_146_368416_g222_i0_p11_ORF_typecomplete_len106_score4_25_NODE_255_length_10547_cov_146_368416_g222_i045754892
MITVPLSSRLSSSGKIPQPNKRKTAIKFVTPQPLNFRLRSRVKEGPRPPLNPRSKAQRVAGSASFRNLSITNAPAARQHALCSCCAGLQSGHHTHTLWTGEGDVA